jgi:hypothetical protein
MTVQSLIWSPPKMRPGHAARVEHQHAARREQQMVDVDEAAHAVGHQHLMRGFVGDAIQAREQRLRRARR